MDILIFTALTTALSFIPPLLWLWFWLKEDNIPEPRHEILFVFLAGMGSVLLAVISEHVICSVNNSFYAGQTLNCPPVKFLLLRVPLYGAFAFQFINTVFFALAEELVKTAAAYWVALKSKLFDEPVDAMIYLVTAALGFAALENALFISDTLKSGVPGSIIVSASRFFNAVLLHVSAAAIIGAGFAFSFFHKERRIKELVLAVFLATFLHSLYNFLILKNTADGVNYQIWATLLVILGASAALILFEKAKRVKI